MQPTPFDAFVFASKAWILRSIRGVKESISAQAPRKASFSQQWHDAPVLAQSITPLWTQTSTAELRLTAGKVENLRIAAQALNGVEVSLGETFSFWRQLGQPNRLKGYREGREIREGCVVPSIAGGLCQLSNALYDAALKANFDILERHKHTRVIAGSLAEQDRDATVFWNYVDLRFKSAQGFRIEIDLSAADLVVTFKGPKVETFSKAIDSDQKTSPKLFAASCETCGVHSCFRHEQMHSAGTHDAAFSYAALLDGAWPEYSQWIAHWISENKIKNPTDIFLPLNGLQRKMSRYSWPVDGARKIFEFPLFAFYRSLVSRRLANQGKKRQLAHIQLNTQLAKNYTSKLPVTALHLVIQQNLLVPLYRQGVLGGRTFDVLMTQAPANRIEATLDQAKEQFPSSPTLSDFRADAQWIQDENRALSRARSIVTPHAKIAKMFPNRGNLIPWTNLVKPHLNRTNMNSKTVFFSGPTVGRKGAYAMRDAAKLLGLKVIKQGAELEGDDFWKGIDVETIPPGEKNLEAALQLVSMVIAPALIESRPVVCLKALSLGIPVIATEACGLPPQNGLIIIPNSSSQAIIDAWAQLFPDNQLSNLSVKAL
ncbi:MAG: VanW family protein [Proteobacteria bacterium]|nr:VanW family protein [Pseudomonadota bacterium]